MGELEGDFLDHYVKKGVGGTDDACAVEGAFGHDIGVAEVVARDVGHFGPVGAVDDFTPVVTPAVEGASVIEDYCLYQWLIG